MGRGRSNCSDLVHYDSDYCNVVQGRAGVTLIFGKLKAGTNQLRTKIEITFSEEMFYRQFWKSSRDLHETTRQVSSKKELPSVEPVVDTDKVQCLHSNNAYMAVLGDEAVLDFYYISPGEIHLARMKQKVDVALDPVVRVVTTTLLLGELLDKCEPFAENLRVQFTDEEK